MGEIKSTLDLVMERTRHLSMSDEEKAQLRRDEALGKIPGYVERYLSGAWDERHLVAELEERSDAELRETMRKRLIRDLLERTSLEGKARRAFGPLELLESTADRPFGRRLREVVDRYDTFRDEWERERTRKRRAELAGRAIAGDAVVIRPFANPEWRRRSREYVQELEVVRSEWEAMLAGERT